MLRACAASSSWSRRGLVGAFDDEDSDVGAIRAERADGVEAIAFDAEADEAFHESVGTFDGEVGGGGFVLSIGDSETNLDGHFGQLGHGTEDEGDLTKDDLVDAGFRVAERIETG